MEQRVDVEMGVAVAAAFVATCWGPETVAVRWRVIVGRLALFQSIGWDVR
ncbi:hypothetical protein RBSWK_00800 [Rhodopirellula baltica SWK14]|uniref:Uncharacterized protein n=1 Tax=Rhodopirellula baltica SWK14 TaxID=993516 RepID=L7CN91_RHOBT|nr:hypothetical protein RBSWK_00800 [Rhodopirellula baltica SWK14]